MNAQEKVAFIAARVGVPVELMKFRFTFDGKLHASGSNSGPRPDDQWAIRRQLYPQLVELWRSHPALSGLGLSVKMPQIHGGNLTLVKDPQPIDIEPSALVVNRLSETIAVGKYNFLPLVRKSLELTCELKITFLRRGAPGALVLPGGDLDNRIKTFFDGLKVPDTIIGNQYGASPDPDPFLCLLEQDSLITSVFVETDRLLNPADTGSPNDARLLVEATIRVMRITPNNVGFLGD